MGGFGFGRIVFSDTGCHMGGLGNGRIVFCDAGIFMGGMGCGRTVFNLYCRKNSIIRGTIFYPWMGGHIDGRTIFIYCGGMVARTKEGLRVFHIRTGTWRTFVFDGS